MVSIGKHNLGFCAMNILPIQSFYGSSRSHRHKNRRLHLTVIGSHFSCSVGIFCELECHKCFMLDSKSSVSSADSPLTAPQRQSRFRQARFPQNYQIRFCSAREQYLIRAKGGTRTHYLRFTIPPLYLLSYLGYTAILPEIQPDIEEC